MIRFCLMYRLWWIHITLIHFILHRSKAGKVRRKPTYRAIQKKRLSLTQITRIQGNAIVLERAPTHTPRIILPIKTHNLAFHSNALWLDNALLLDDVLSFLITPIVSAQGTFLALELCVKSPTKARCENGGVWLDDIVRILL